MRIRLSGTQLIALDRASLQASIQHKTYASFIRRGLVIEIAEGYMLSRIGQRIHSEAYARGILGRDVNKTTYYTFEVL